MVLQWLMVMSSKRLIGLVGWLGVWRDPGHSVPQTKGVVSATSRAVGPELGRGGCEGDAWVAIDESGLAVVAGGVDESGEAVADLCSGAVPMLGILGRDVLGFDRSEVGEAMLLSL